MRYFILDTDWGEDCDDVMAARVLCNKVKTGEAAICGIVINYPMKDSAASLFGFLNEEKISAPVGIEKRFLVEEGYFKYQSRLAKFAPDKTNDDAEDGIRLYRRALSEAPCKVNIMEIGFLQVLSAVIESEPDDISPLSGIELFKEKVERVWIMGGKWDQQAGREYNFANNERTRIATSIVCEKCPVPITFLGWEVGDSVYSGGAKVLDETDPLLGAMCDHGAVNGRSSWDPMLVYMAILGDEEKAGYTTVTGTARVDGETGLNYFEENENGLHRYVVKKYDDSYYADIVNKMIQPKK
ncbi:MAG: nucleoside hydrolase [Clostridia bacterium]|nr:nucleoside hydrolase [Clostridia bacterium]